jgi:hypothetical protein
MSQPPRNRPPTRRVSTGQPEQPQGSTRSQAGKPPASNVNAPRRSDPFPIVLGAVIGAMVIGLLVVVYLISSNNGSTGGTGGTGGTTANGGGQPTTAAQNPTPAGAAQDDNATLNPNATAGPTEEPPPRMTLADFKALYDNPAKRPLIIDVRAKEAFDAGHIKGAISFPESDVDTRIGELPKDKLVVAYCQ